MRWYPLNTRLLLACLLLFRLSANAQMAVSGKLLFEEYNTENSSMISNTIYNVFYGKDGYLWFISDLGLIKFDGNDFEKVVRGDIINAYKTDGEILVLIFFNGMTRGLNMSTHKIINTDSLWGLHEGVNTRPFTMIYEKDNNLILIKNEYLAGDSKNTAVAITGKHARYITNLSFISQLLRPIMGTKAAADQLEKMKAPYFFRASKNTIILNGMVFEKADKNDSYQLLFDGTADHYEITSYAKEGRDLWLGTRNKGLIVYRDYQLKTEKKITLLPYSISGMLKDYNDNIWISTMENGLLQLRSEEMGIRYYTNPGLDFEGDMINSIQKTSSGSLAFTHNRKQSVQIWNNQKRVFWHHFDNPVEYLFQQGDHIYFLEKDIYTFKGLPPHSGLKQVEQNKLHMYNWKDLISWKEQVYALTNISQFRFDTTGAQQSDVYNSIINKTTYQKYNDQGHIIGTTKGVFWNGTKLNWLSNTHFLKIRIVGSQVFCCTMDGIYTIKLNRLRDSSALIRIGNEIAHDIKQDSSFIFLRTKESILWVDTQNYGIIRKFSSENFTIPFSINDFFIDRDSVAVAGNKGLFYFPKDYFLPKKGIAPPVHLLNSLNNNQSSDSFYRCDFKKQLAATFTLDILDYSTDVKTIKYRITKDGEPFYEWATLNEHNVVQMNQPLPGSYSIEYKISCIERNWSKDIKYTFVVTPLWWQTPWMRLLEWFLGIAAVSALTAYLLRSRYRKNVAKMNEMLFKNELESEALFAQMQPHFIFNALIPFQDLAIKGDIAGALDYVQTFSRLIRGLLRNSRNKIVTINDELDFIRNYIKIQQHLLKNSFTAEINIGEGIDTKEVMIPSMLIQPIVENAIEHGLSDTTGGKIIIDILLRDGTIAVSIKDNGKGFKEDPQIKSTHALDIIKNRLALIKKISGTGALEFSDAAGQTGAHVTLLLPYKTKQNKQPA